MRLTTRDVELIRHLHRLDSKPVPNSYGFIFRGKTSPEFRQRLVDDFNSLPASITSMLRSKGVVVAIGGVMDDIRPGYCCSYDEPTEADSRQHQNQSSGFYYKKLNTVALVEHVCVSRNPKIGDRPGLSNLRAGEWKIVEPHELAGIMRHEVGHVFDEHIGNFSATKSFREQLQKDAGALSEEQKKKYAYYFRPDAEKKSAEEVFAQAFAILQGGIREGPEEAKAFSEAFPNCSAAVKNHLAAFEKAYAEGPSAVQRFADEVYDDAHPVSAMRLFGAPISDGLASCSVTTAWKTLSKAQMPSLSRMFFHKAENFRSLPPPAGNVLRTKLAADVILAGEGFVPDIREVESIIRQMDLRIDQNTISAIRGITQLSMDLAKQVAAGAKPPIYVDYSATPFPPDPGAEARRRTLQQILQIQNRPL
jgi:hypothetical protein